MFERPAARASEQLAKLCVPPPPERARAGARDGFLPPWQCRPPFCPSFDSHRRRCAPGEPPRVRERSQCAERHLRERRRSTPVRSSAAFVFFPVSVPFQRPATSHHGAGDITTSWRHAPGRRARAATRSLREAAHGRAAHQHVTLRARAGRRADEPHQRVARLRRIGGRAGLIRAAGAIVLARGDPGQSDAWALRAPDRSIAVPHPSGRADENLACGNDGSRGENGESEHDGQLT